MARARPVKRDEMEIAFQPAEKRVAELVKLRSEPVDEEDRPPLPGLGVMDAVAVDFDEFAGRRHMPHGLGGDLLRREDEIAKIKDRTDKQHGKDPGEKCWQRRSLE